MKTIKCLRGVLAVTMIFLAVPAFASTSGEDPNWNVSIDPLALIVGPNVTLDYKISDQWTVGAKGDLVLFNLGSVHASGGGIGLQSTYYFNRAFQRGWFMNGGVNYSVFHAKYTDDAGFDDSVSYSDVSIPVIGGYKWFWGNFNLSLGAGPVVHFRSTSDITDKNGNSVKSLGSTVGVAGVASIGWTF